MTNIIRNALEALPGHWYKGNYSDGNGNYCAGGHCANEMDKQNVHTTQDKEGYIKQVKMLAAVAYEQFPERFMFSPRLFWDIAQFNDHRDTTEEEVIMVMEKAANKVDELL